MAFGRIKAGPMTSAVIFGVSELFCKYPVIHLSIAILGILTGFRMKVMTHDLYIALSRYDMMQ